MDWGKKVVLKSGVVIKEVDGEAVLLDLDSEIYHGLNSTGAAMLNEVMGASSVNDGFNSITKQFVDVDPQLIRTDLKALLDSLQENKIIEWVD